MYAVLDGKTETDLLFCMHPYFHPAVDDMLQFLFNTLSKSKFLQLPPLKVTKTELKVSSHSIIINYIFLFLSNTPRTHRNK